MKRTLVYMFLLALTGCQPDTPAQQVAPAASEAPAVPTQQEKPLAADAGKVASTPAKPVPQAAPVRSETTGQVQVPQPVPAAEPAPVKVAAPAAPQAQAAVLSDAEGRKLAQRSNCFACHAIDRKLVGPSWKDIAAKYRGQKDAEARLVERVAKGGSGVWGSSPMPPNAPRVSAEDIRALVRFILVLE